MLRSKIQLPAKILSQSIPASLFSASQSDTKPLFRIEELKKTVLDKDREQTKNLKEMLKKKQDFLQETSVSFYELEIVIELYYQHNSSQSVYVKSLLDFSNVNFTGVGL